MASRAREEQTAHPRPVAPDGAYQVDSERSDVGFAVKKMGMYHVKGRFRDIEGRIEFPVGGAPRAEATIDVRGIYTRIPPRDWHLRTAQFLHVDEHPRIHFHAENLDALGNRANRLQAEFEIRGSRRPVELTAHIERREDETLHLHLEGTLDRHDFGIRPPQPFEMIVGDEVKLDVDIIAVPA